MNLPILIRRIFAQVFRFWGGETSLRVLGPKEILIGVALISVARATIDMVLWIRILSITVWFVTCLLWFFYILSLSLSTAFLLSRFIPGNDFRQILTMAVCVYWVIPFVSLFSLSPWEKAWGLGMWATIPFFRWIPTFLVERNYLPLGMLAVIPFILLMASRFIAQTTGTSRMRAFVLTLAAFVLIYVVYYQWCQRALAIAFFDKGFGPWEAMAASYVTYSFLSQMITFLLSPVIARAYKEYPSWIYLMWSGVPLVVLLLIPRVGFFSLFLAAGQP